MTTLGTFCATNALPLYQGRGGDDLGSHLTAVDPQSPLHWAIVDVIELTLHTPEPDSLLNP